MERRSGLLHDDGHDNGHDNGQRNFVGYLQNMKLPHPGRIAEALPATLRGGLVGPPRFSAA